MVKAYFAAALLVTALWVMLLGWFAFEGMSALVSTAMAQRPQAVDSSALLKDRAEFQAQQ